jgi:hypothetical protein
MSSTQNSSLSTQHAVLMVFALCCVTAAMDHANAQKTQTAQSNPGQSAHITAALQTNFGSALEAETGFKPFYVTGDFNGDGAQDVAVVVRIKKGRSALPKDARVLNPFQLERTISFPANPGTENKLALVIIHGWKAPQPVGKYLLIGESPILILEHERVISNQPADRNQLIGLISRRVRPRKGLMFPRAAKGDVITLVTEVGGDSLLYWNGRTYVWEDSAED